MKNDEKNWLQEQVQKSANAAEKWPLWKREAVARKGSSPGIKKEASSQGGSNIPRAK